MNSMKHKVPDCTKASMDRDEPKMFNTLIKFNGIKENL